MHQPEWTKKILGLKLWQWLSLAVAVFLIASFSLFFISALDLFPGLTNGRGGWEFAPDSGDTLTGVTKYVAVIQSSHPEQAAYILGPWYSGKAAKYYAPFGRYFGVSYPGLIPGSLLLYVLMLCGVYVLGRRLWGTKQGFIAAVLCGLWPSMFVHLTQPLKDPVFIAGQVLFMLSAVLVWQSVRKRDVFWALAVGVLGFCLSNTVRPHVLMINTLVWSFLWVGLVVRVLRRRQWFSASFWVGTCCLVVLASHTWLMTGGMPFVAHYFPGIYGRQPVSENALGPDPLPTIEGKELELENYYPNEDKTVAFLRGVFHIDAPEVPVPAVSNTETPASSIIEKPQEIEAQDKYVPQDYYLPEDDENRVKVHPLMWQIAKRRYEWSYTHRNSWSNTEGKVKFETLQDLLLFAPRALQIGFLAPFPELWFIEGRRVGRVGRILSGIEMPLIYLLLMCAIATLIRERKRFEIWVLFCFVLIGVSLLGLIVTNMGALYRMRYVFWCILFVLASPSVVLLAGVFKRWRRGVPQLHGNRKRVLRIITRTNVGGPAIHALILNERLDKQRYESWLASGQVDAHEEDFLKWFSSEPNRLVLIKDLRKNLSPIKDFQTILSLFFLIKRLRPDIVHTHLAKAGTLGRVAAWLARTPVIIHTYHGHVLKGYFPRGKEKFYTWVEKQLSRITTCLVTVSEKVRDELVAMGIGRAEQYQVIPLGLDLDRFLDCEIHKGSLRKELGFEIDQPVVGIVARLTAIKRHQDLLQAAEQVIQAHPKARFLIVGDGEERESLEFQTQQKKLQKHVQFLGWRQDLERIYADCDVVTLVSANEGLPVSLIEAMASARPVVATAVGGVPDLIDDNQTGVLVPAQKPEALAVSLIALLNERQRAESLGQKARASAQSAYRAQRLVGDLEVLYDALLKERG